MADKGKVMPSATVGVRTWKPMIQRAISGGSSPGVGAAPTPSSSSPGVAPPSPTPTPSTVSAKYKKVVRNSFKLKGIKASDINSSPALKVAIRKSIATAFSVLLEQVKVVAVQEGRRRLALAHRLSSTDKAQIKYEILANNDASIVQKSNALGDGSSSDMSSTLVTELKGYCGHKCTSMSPSSTIADVAVAEVDNNPDAPGAPGGSPPSPSSASPAPAPTPSSAPSAGPAPVPTPSSPPSAGSAPAPTPSSPPSAGPAPAPTPKSRGAGGDGTDGDSTGGGSTGSGSIDMGMIIMGGAALFVIAAALGHFMGRRRGEAMALKRGLETPGDMEMNAATVGNPMAGKQSRGQLNYAKKRVR